MHPSFTIDRVEAVFRKALAKNRKSLGIAQFNRVRALRLARVRIAAIHEHRYICNALMDVAYAHPVLEPACEELRLLIMQRLDGCGSLESWLAHNHDIDADFYVPAVRAKLRTTRLAWIDSLIKEFGG